MTDSQTIAAVLLIVGPLLGAVPVANPSLIPVWSASREARLAIVGAHRREWALLNAGFGFATVLTATGLAIVALGTALETARAGGLVLALVAYALGGTLWLSALAIRTRTAPSLADMVAAGTDPGPAETLVGAATTGLFDGFVVATCAALVALGATFLLAGGVAAPVAGLIALAGALCMTWLVATGDVIPAVLYLPTLLLGIAMLAGWT